MPTECLNCERAFITSDYNEYCSKTCAEEFAEILEAGAARSEALGLVSQERTTTAIVGQVLNNFPQFLKRP